MMPLFTGKLVNFMMHFNEQIKGYNLAIKALAVQLLLKLNGTVFSFKNVSQIGMPAFFNTKSKHMVNILFYTFYRIAGEKSLLRDEQF